MYFVDILTFLLVFVKSRYIFASSLNTKTMVLAFTTSRHAYGKNIDEAKQKLTKVLKENNTTSKVCYIADVSNIPNGTEILHYYCEKTGEIVCKTSQDVDIPFEKVDF